MSTKINIFDFDGTLTNDTWPKFWVWVKKFGYDGSKRNDELEAALAEYRKTHDGDHLETFFGFFNDLLTTHDASISHEELMEGEQYIIYNPGVEDFLATTASTNYIVSGGLTDFLKGLHVAKYFKGIYGTPSEYDENGLITHIGKVMTNADKILAIQDILNSDGRDNYNCENVTYIGDGYSDAESMRFVHEHGGKAIFVHQPDNNDKFAEEHNLKIFQMLLKDGVVDYSFVADYSIGTDLFNALN